MADINVTVTTPTTITATATDPNTVAVSVSAASTVSVTASVGNVGDMTKAVYDTDNDGVVDNSEALGGVAASGFVQTGNASWVDLTDGGATSLHSHANDHARQHSITSTSDHTSTATSGQMLQADANGLPVNATNTDAQVSAAVTASHAAVTVADSASIDMTLTGQQISAAAIFGTGAGVVAEGNHTHSYQPLDTELTAIAGLTSAADKGIQFTGSGTAGTFDLTTAGKALLDDADAAAQRTTLSVPANVGTSVADNFVSFSNTTGAQKDSGKGLTHLVYTLQTAGVAAANPADGSTYYFGGENTATTGANIRRIYFPFSGTVVYASVVILVNTVLGDTTQFSCYIRINNTTDLTITTTAQANAAIQKFSNAALSTAVTGDTDYFEGKITYPTWPTTNPTGVKAYFVVGVRV